MSTFDIMLPYYGDVSLMQAAVRSVQDQTDGDWRLTVVDDGQEPGVPEWFAEIGDERIRYIRNERNLGVTDNYRKCVGLVEHDHVVLMGTDDIMLPNYLAVVRSALRQYPDVAMVEPGVEVIDSNGERIHTLVDQTKRRLYAPKVRGRRLMGGEELATSLLRGNWLYFSSICWRADVLRSMAFRDGYDVIQDLALVIDVLQSGAWMLLDETVCFQYRRHQVSLSSVRAFNGSRFTEAEAYFLDVAARLDKHGWPKAAKAARLHVSSRLHAASLVPGAVRTKQTEGARALARHALGSIRRTD